MSALRVCARVLPAFRERDDVVQTGAHRFGPGEYGVDPVSAEAARPFVPLEDFDSVERLHEGLADADAAGYCVLPVHAILVSVAARFGAVAAASAIAIETHRTERAGQSDARSARLWIASCPFAATLAAAVVAVSGVLDVLGERAVAVTSRTDAAPVSNFARYAVGGIPMVMPTRIVIGAPAASPSGLVAPRDIASRPLRVRACSPAQLHVAIGSPPLIVLRAVSATRAGANDAITVVN